MVRWDESHSSRSQKSPLVLSVFLVSFGNAVVIAVADTTDCYQRVRTRHKLTNSPRRGIKECLQCRSISEYTYIPRTRVLLESVSILGVDTSGKSVVEIW